MAFRDLRIRAAIFDTYNTLLTVGPPPADADARWQALFRDFFSSEPPCGRLDFAVASNQAIARRHDAARAAGIDYPEIHWPSIVAEILPGFGRLSPEAQGEFVYQQIQTGHTTSLSAEVATALPQLRRQGCRLGIASNAQAYSLRELAEGLAGHGLDLELFDRDLRFWSFEHGFSKPDPHVFRILTARLEARGITPDETLMVGDRLDNDLDPARRVGWRTFQIGATPAAKRGTEWSDLVRLVQR